MPSAGELWRVRRGLASRQVAEVLRVHPARVTKWEKGTAAPPGELVATLLDLLHARPDERTVLSNRRFLLDHAAEPLAACSSVEDYERRLDDLSIVIRRGQPLPGDLYFLALEAAVWPLAAAASRPGRARRLLADTYRWHTEWLVRNDRGLASGVYAQRSLELASADPATPVGRRHHALTQVAQYAATRRPNRAGYREAYELLESGLGVRHEGDPSLQSQTLREMANYAFNAGDSDQALRLAAKATRLAAQGSDADYLHDACIVHALLLNQMGEAARALGVLPEPVLPERCARGSSYQTLLWARILLAAGDRTTAHDYLARAFTLANRFGFTGLRAEADRLALQV